MRPVEADEHAGAYNFAFNSIYELRDSLLTSRTNIQSALRSTGAALIPPNPNEFDKITSARLDPIALYVVEVAPLIRVREIHRRR